MAQHQAQKQPQKQRDDLSGEHPLGDAGQLVLACLFIAIWVLDMFVLKYTTLLNKFIPLFIRIPLGVALVSVSFYLAAMGLHIVFGERREKPAVITKSVFGITRHPIYLSEILLYLGLLMMSLSLAAAFVCGIAILFLHHISRHEERLLLARFGEEYSQYIQKVPMWLPQPWKKRGGVSESMGENNKS
jgi:protein-S-isoprenylcysteine O-methyltransferase Ste14